MGKKTNTRGPEGAKRLGERREALIFAHKYLVIANRRLALFVGSSAVRGFVGSALLAQPAEGS